jgi:hypothetical protein
MKNIEIEAASTQTRIRAIAVAAGLMTEEQAEDWIVVRAGEFGKGHFKDVQLPSVCEGCGHEHSSDEQWMPMEIGISREMPERTRAALMMLVQTAGSSTVN